MSFRDLFAIDRHERAALAIAFLYFFGLLTSYYMLRSVREAMGVRHGPENYSWLYTTIFVCMVIAQPLYGALVARFARRVFVPLVYVFFLVFIIAFFFTWQIESARDAMAPVFYVWLSIANLFTVSVFWSYMTDIFSSDQAKRMFGFIAAGGSTGGLFGALLTMLLADRIDIDGIFALSFVFLLMATICAALLGRHAAAASQRSDAAEMDALIGGTSFAAFRLVVTRLPLRWLALFMILSGVGGGILYTQQAFAVRELFASDGERAAYFAQIDLLTNLLALLLEIFVARWLFLNIGTARILTLMPLMLMGGFAILLTSPAVILIAVFQVLSRGIRFAFGETALASCYTTLSREIRYKGKGFIDTFVYRLSDVVSQWSVRLLTQAGVTNTGLYLFGVCVAGCTAIIGYVIGRQHEKRQA